MEYAIGGFDPSPSLTDQSLYTNFGYVILCAIGCGPCTAFLYPMGQMICFCAARPVWKMVHQFSAQKKIMEPELFYLVVREMIKRGANCDQGRAAAVECKDTETLQEFFANGANVNQ
jgi:hypothetical protein